MNRDEQDETLDGVPDPTAADGEIGRVANDLHPRPGERIGQYQVRERLGEGGFGVVLHCEQSEPVRREVAVKILKAGMDSEKVIARFEAERQALAMMDHPNIAKVLDAGATEQGRPYFVMELVRGLPLTEYCDEKKLSLERRLRLFIRICDGVQHAHQRGIIHRDLKPANILVSTDGSDEAVPKVIDFGIAKAMARTLTDKTIFTERGEMIGTLEYMSPEQAETRVGDLDVRSDVYALGVVLYELLSGQLPFEADALRRAGYAEMRRIICEEDAPKPSTRLTTAGGDLGTRIAERRRTRVSDLQSMLRRELEWIPLKAMRKSRDERYESVGALADDIRRYLAGEPLEAGPESMMYRLRKNATRHKGLVAAVAAVVTSLVIGAIGTTIFAVRSVDQARLAEKRADQATIEATRARTTKDFLIQMISSVDPAIAQGADTTLLRAVLARAAEGLETQFESMPLVEAEIQEMIGNTYWSIGDSLGAAPHQQRAFDLYVSVLGPSDERSVTAGNRMVVNLYGRGDVAGAERLARTILESSRRDLGDDHPDTVSAIGNHAFLLNALGRSSEAGPLYREAYETSRATLGPEDSSTLISANNLAAFDLEEGRLAEATRLFESVHRIRERTLGSMHPDTILSLHNLGKVVFESGRFEDGLAMVEEAYERRVVVLGDDHPRTIGSIRILGELAERSGETARADALFERAITAQDRLLGADHPETLSTRWTHADLLIERGLPDRAMAIHEGIVESLRGTVESEDARLLEATRRLRECREMMEPAGMP